MVQGQVAIVTGKGRLLYKFADLRLLLLITVYIVSYKE